MHTTRTRTLVYIVGVIPLWNLTVVISCTVYNLKTVQDISIKLHRKWYKASSDDMQTTRTVPLVYIILELFPFEVVSCLLYNLKNIQGILMKLNRNVKHHQTCRIFTLDFVLPSYHLNKCHKGFWSCLSSWRPYTDTQTAGGKHVVFFLLKTALVGICLRVS